MNPLTPSKRVHGKLALTLGCALASATFVSAQQETPQPSVAEAISNEMRSVFEHCQKAIVKIEATDAHGQLSGTGFFIDPQGTIYTSYTIGGESQEIVVSQGDRKFPARRLVADARGGIALLKVDAETPFLPLGKSSELTSGAPVIAIGYPMDLPLTPSFGTVAGFDLKYLGRYFATKHIRANVPVQRGQGGAPLLNMHGEVVGILISSLDSGSALFALPIEAAEKIRSSFMRFGEVRPGWMGIEVTGAPEPQHGSVAQIRDLVETGPGAKFGLKPGDVILQMGDMKITSPEDVLNASFFITAEDTMSLKVDRGGQIVDIAVTPVDRPDTSRIAQPSDSALSPTTRGLQMGFDHP